MSEDLKARLRRRAESLREDDDVREDAAKALEAIERHDARVTELLEANNREVERRRAAELDAEQRRALVEERWADAANLKLQSAGYNPAKGTFDLNLQGIMVPYVAAALAADFDASKCENYVGFQFRAPPMNGKPGRSFMLTMQRINGETPPQKAARLERELAEARRVLGAALEDTARELGCALDNEAILARARQVMETLRQIAKRDFNCPSHQHGMAAAGAAERVLFGAAAHVRTPAQIAAELSASRRRILRDACRPREQRDTFPGLLNPDRRALLAAGLIRNRGYDVEATDLGRQVEAACHE